MRYTPFSVVNGGIYRFLLAEVGGQVIEAQPIDEASRKETGAVQKDTADPGGQSTALVSS